MPRVAFQSLGPDYCSLGGTLDYYELLFKQGRPIYRTYLKRGAWRFDIQRRYRSPLCEFGRLQGFVAQFSHPQSAPSPTRRGCLRGDAPATKRRGGGFLMKFKTRVAVEANSFTIEFDFRRHGGLPNRVNALIGYNGTGKTQLLSNLAIVTVATDLTNKEDFLRTPSWSVRRKSSHLSRPWWLYSYVPVNILRHPRSNGDRKIEASR